MSTPFDSRNGLHVIDTQRRYPRSMRETFSVDYRTSAIGVEGPVVIRTRTPWWLRVWNALLGKP